MKKVRNNISPTPRTARLALVREPELLPEGVRRALELLDAVEAQTHPALALLDELEVDEHRAIEAPLERLRLLRAIEAHLMGAVDKLRPVRVRRPDRSDGRA